MISESHVILETEGILGEVFPEVFKTRLPQILDRHRRDHVHMQVTTEVNCPPGRARTQGCYFRAARQGHPPEFTWQAGGVLHPVLRQFRLDFLRHLGPEELRCRIRLGIYLNEEPAATARPAAPPRSAIEGRNAREPEVAEGGSRPVTPPVRDAVQDPGEKYEVQRPAAQAAPQPPRIERRGDTLLAQVIDATQAAPYGEQTPPAPPARQERTSRPAAEKFKWPGGDPQPEMRSTAGMSDLERDERRPHSNVASHSLPGHFYLDYFGFECMPFNNTPDTHFFFPTEKHQEGLSRLLYAIAERKGFVMISGEIGSGKSTLCRMLLSQLPQEVKTALITHTHLDQLQLLQAIAEDLGLEARGRSRYDILQILNEYLVAQLAEGCTVCIIIDEAQNLATEVLEEIRMISNLETEQEKLVQLILLGQPELRDKIRQPELLQLRQRIAVQYHLEPLSREETVEYITHRLKVANPSEPLHFTQAAMHEMFRHSGGVPRLINTLGDNALLSAYTHETRQITPRLIREAARDLDLSPRAGDLAHFLKFW